MRSSKSSYTVSRDPAEHFAGAGTDLFDLAVSLADDVAHAEVELLGAILADHTQLLPVARAAGVTAAVFQYRDLSLFFEALIDRGHLSLVDVLCAVRAALQREHFWDSQGPIGFGCKWSDESLALLTGSYPASTVTVEAYAHRLLMLSQRWTLAVECHTRLRGLLSGELQPGDLPRRATLRPPSRVVIAPLRYHDRKPRSPRA